MAQAHSAHGAGKYYIPHGSKWPAVGAAALFITMLGTAAVLNGVERGTVDRLPRPRRRGLHVLRLVRHGHQRERGRPLQRRRGSLVPHGHELVHLLRGDVLRGLLRRAVLRAPAVGAVARRRGLAVHDEPVPVARVRVGLADQRPRQRGRLLRDDPGVRAAGDQHRDPAHLGRDDHDRAPRAQGGQPRHPEDLPRADLHPRLRCSSACRPRNTSTPTTS